MSGPPTDEAVERQKVNSQKRAGPFSSLALSLQPKVTLNDQGALACIEGALTPRSERGLDLRVAKGPFTGPR